MLYVINFRTKYYKSNIINIINCDTVYAKAKIRQDSDSTRTDATFDVYFLAILMQNCAKAKKNQTSLLLFAFALVSESVCFGNDKIVYLIIFAFAL